MTDKELISMCLTAFEAIPVAAHARKLLKKMNKAPGAWAGNGSDILAKTMAKMIEEHLNGGI